MLVTKWLVRVFFSYCFDFFFSLLTSQAEIETAQFFFFYLSEMPEFTSGISCAPSASVEMRLEAELPWPTCLKDSLNQFPRVWNVAWHPVDPFLLAVCGSGNVVYLWSKEKEAPESLSSALPTVAVAEKWRVVAALKGQHDRSIRHVSWSPSGTFLACASFDTTVSIWVRNEVGGMGSEEDVNEVQEWVVEGVLDGHESEVKCVEWLTDTVLLTASRDRNLWVWERMDEGEYECGGILSGHSQDVKFGLFAPVIGRRFRPILLGAEDESNELSLEVPFHVVSCSYDGTVRVWREEVHRGEDWNLIQTLRPHGEHIVWCAAFQSPMENNRLDSTFQEENSSDSREIFPLLCTSSDDLSVSFYRYDLQKQKYTVIAQASGFANRSLYAVHWAPASISLVAVASGDNSLTLLGLHEDADGLHPRVVFRESDAHHADVNTVCFYPTVLKEASGSSLLLASGGDDGAVRLWKVTPNF